MSLNKTKVRSCTPTCPIRIKSIARIVYWSWLKVGWPGYGAMHTLQTCTGPVTKLDFSALATAFTGQMAFYLAEMPEKLPVTTAAVGFQ